MPTIAVDKARLFEALGQELVDGLGAALYWLTGSHTSYTTEDFDDLCFDFGTQLGDLVCCHS